MEKNIRDNDRYLAGHPRSTVPFMGYLTDACAQYVSPTTNVSAQGWAILLHLMPHPYEVNNPAINQSLHTQNCAWYLEDNFAIG